MVVHRYHRERAVSKGKKPNERTEVDAFAHADVRDANSGAARAPWPDRRDVTRARAGWARAGPGLRAERQGHRLERSRGARARGVLHALAAAQSSIERRGGPPIRARTSAA